MTDDQIRQIEENTERAKDSLRDLKEATGFALDSIERVGKFSKRTASVGFGASLGVVLGIFFVVLTSSSRFEIPQRYQNWLIFGMGLGGASAGTLFIRETGEEKARRLETAAAEISDNPSMIGFMQNILEEHTLVTRANAAKTAELRKEVRQKYLLREATQPEVTLEAMQQQPQAEQLPAAQDEE